ncbi:MAG: hypothetical protein ABI402_17730 [Ferruginibacter sp.]
MFNQAWKKYLPVITILLKRSANGEQTLNMNHTDFERAAGGRKMKWSFPALILNNGRILNNGTKHPALATEMVTELQVDDPISKLLKNQEFEFSMTNDFKLLIKNISVITASDAEAVEEGSPIEQTILD